MLFDKMMDGDLKNHSPFTIHHSQLIICSTVYGECKMNWYAQKKCAPYENDNTLLNICRVRSVCERTNMLYNPFMPEYRRAIIEGGIYLFTLVTYRRQRLFSQPHVRELLHEAFNHIHKFHQYKMLAYCFLPDHIHFVWQLPENDADYSTRISLIKSRFSKIYVAQFGLPFSKDASRFKRREVTVWQRRFWEHTICDEDDLNLHIDYIHYNPVKHGLVDRVCDWEDSSFISYVDVGCYELDWGNAVGLHHPDDRFGE
jgi:putative transposase